MARSDMTTIKDIMKMDDSALLELLGLNTRLEAFKDTVKKGNELKGQKRERFEMELQRALNPEVRTYMLEDMVTDETKPGPSDL